MHSLTTTSLPIYCSLQSLSRVWLFVTPWTAECHASLPITIFWSLLKIMSVESVMPSSVVPFSFCLQTFPASGSFPMSQFFWYFGIRWQKYWSFSFSINPFNEYSGLISFRIDWLDLIVVQETRKNLLQPHSSKASVLRGSAFFYGPTLTSIHGSWENHCFMRQTFVGTVMSLLFNMLSRLVITFLPRSKHLLISWLQSPSAVI